MKHIFVVNPQAGGIDSSGKIERMLQGVSGEVEVYVTQAPRDATRYVARRCEEADNEVLRFYACGGDGTLNEVVSGAVGHEGVEVGCYPCGSGNDYVKCFPEVNFLDIESQMKGQAMQVDVMQIAVGNEVRYCLNTLNFGFEAEVCRTMADVRRKPLIGGKMSYTTGIVHSLATSRRNPCAIEVDGKGWHQGDLLLMSLANGRYAGGGYLCAPRSVCDDGWLEVMAIRPMGIGRFAKMIKYYERGEHLDRPELQNDIRYCRGRRVVIDSDNEFFIAIDGELLRGKRFEVCNLERGIRFVVPQKNN